MDCTIHVAKTKVLISFTVIVKLICFFVLTYAKSRFSHDEAQVMLMLLKHNMFLLSNNYASTRDYGYYYICEQQRLKQVCLSK